MTRGDLNQVRQRLRGMDNDIRRVSGSSGEMSERARVMGREINTVSRRLEVLNRTGRASGREMTYMNRTLGILGRELRQAANAGHISRNQFNSLRNELERTRIDFDRLNRDITRHTAIAQRDARAERDRTRAVQAMGRAHAQALRMEEARNRAEQRAAQIRGRLQAAALREDEQRIRARARMQIAAMREDEDRIRRLARLQIAAQREEAQRNAAAQRQALRDADRNVIRFRASQGDSGLTSTFRGAGIGDDHSLVRGFANIRALMSGVTASTDEARHHVNLFSRDMDAMSTILNRARETGHITRRDYDALSTGLAAASNNAHNLHRANVLNRDEFRRLSDEIRRLRDELNGLDTDGSVFSRLHRRLGLLHNRLRDVDSSSGRFRHTLARLAAPLVDGFRRALPGLAVMLSYLGKMGGLLKINARWTAILIAFLLLLGPAAQAIGALLVAALGGAFIALGALALKGNASVKKAFSDMKKSVAFDVRDAAQPLAQYLVAGMDQVSAAVTRMKPLLEGAFRATGPLVENFVGAFTDMASVSMIGIVQALKDMGPAMEGFRSGMALLGKGIGHMFNAMTENGGAAALGRVWVTLGNEMDNLLTNIGEFIAMAAKSETATMLLVTVFRSLSGILHVVEGGLSAVDSLFGGLFSRILRGGLDVDNMSTGMNAMHDSFTLTGKSADDLATRLEDVDKRIASLRKEQKKYQDGAKDKSKPGAYRDLMAQGLARTTEELNGLLAYRGELTSAIALSEAQAENATYRHAEAVRALKKSIEDLNTQMLSQFDAKAAMEASIDAFAERLKDFKGKIDISPSGVLNMDTKAGQQFQGLVSNLVRDTTEYVHKLEEANASQGEIDAAWQRGRDTLMGLSGTYGINKAALAAYIDTILQTPESVKTRLEVEKAQAEANIESLRARINQVDGKEAKTKATMDAFRAMERASQLDSKLNALNGKSVTSYATTVFTEVHNVKYNAPTGKSVHDIVGATGGMFTGSGFTKRGFADGGQISGPGTGTSDDIFAPWLSNGEFVINARQTKKYLPLIEAINNDKIRMSGFASGGKVSSATKEARNDLKGQFGISYFGRLAGYKNNSFEKSLAKPDSLGSLVSSLNQTLRLIQKAFSGKTEKYLTDRLKSAGKALIKYEKSLTKVNASLEKAKDKLADLKQAAASMKDSVKSGVLSATNVTGVATGDDKNITMADIMSRMSAGVDKSSAFSKALKDLQARGVSKTIIQQIAEAGIEGGGLETAGAILSGSDSQIAQINEMQKKIDASAASAGKTASDALYLAGIRAAEGLVKGLTKKQKSIENAMMKIAKSMEKALKHALGIKSPSRVMQEVGHYTAEGFALGIEKNRSVDTAWASMLNTGPSVGSAISGGAGRGDGQYVFPVYIGNKMIDEIVLDANRRIVRTRGGNVQSVFGRKTS